MNPGSEAVVTIRRATGPDARPAADVWLRSFAAALPTVVSPRSADDVRDYFRDVVVPLREIWVADAGGGDEGGGGDGGGGGGGGGGGIVGLMVVNGDLLSQLYLDPDWRGRGLGDRFVGLAKERSPEGLHLWTFQVNKPAHRFYERHGFVAVEFTDGSGNEEREPDVRYVWEPKS